MTPACAALAFLGMFAAGAKAQEPASPSRFDQPFPYLIVDQALSDALAELGRHLGMAIEVSDDAGDKRIRRYAHDGSAGDFLDHLAADHDLDWIVDGGRLSVSSPDERITRSWSGDAVALETAKAALDGAGLGDPRYPLGIGSARGEFSLSAPPRYMASAAAVIDRALSPEAVRTVTVIHGRARRDGT